MRMAPGGRTRGCVASVDCTFLVLPIFGFSLVNTPVDTATEVDCCVSEVVVFVAPEDGGVDVEDIIASTRPDDTRFFEIPDTTRIIINMVC